MSPACISLLFDEKLRLVRMLPTLQQFSSDHECAFRNETVVVCAFEAVRLNEFPNIHFRQNKRWISFLHPIDSKHLEFDEILCCHTHFVTWSFTMQY